MQVVRHEEIECAPRRSTPMIVGCIGTPSDVPGQSESRIYTSCLSFTAAEISTSNFLARRTACRRAHRNHRLASLCTANMAAVVGAENRRCRVFGSSSQPRSAILPTTFFDHANLRAAFILFLFLSHHARPSVLVSLTSLHSSSPSPPSPLSMLHAS